MNSSELEPTQDDLQYIFHLKHGHPTQTGWGPRMRLRFNYYTPDDYYEALLAKVINDNTNWLDVGCGHHIFPSNRPLAQILADRCCLLVGVDPDDTLDENPFVHEKVKSTIENFQTETTFNVITLRMVAEHFFDPEKAVASLARLTGSSGKVIVYTVNKWSPVPVIARLLPFRLHHFFTRILWGTAEKDTFPVAYQMNSRRRLKEKFEAGGFEERYFAFLEDCRTFGRFRPLLHVELCLRTLCHSIGLRYPEYCLLGVYERQQRSSKKEKPCLEDSQRQCAAL